MDHGIDHRRFKTLENDEFLTEDEEEEDRRHREALSNELEE